MSTAELFAYTNISDAIRVLKQEHHAAVEDINQQIELLDGEIARVDAEIESMAASPSVSTAALRSYAGVSRELQKLEEANDAFDQNKILKSKVKKLETERREIADAAITLIQANINLCLSELNERICGPERTSPQLTFNGTRSYKFSIPNDTGTGSQVRGMLLLDYVILTDTSLPAISEDTVSIKQVADKSLLAFLTLCAESDKQVFMAIDKAESLEGEDKLPAVIEENVVLSLSDGHELYGRQWGIRSDE